MKYSEFEFGLMSPEKPQPQKLIEGEGSSMECGLAAKVEMRGPYEGPMRETHKTTRCDHDSDY